jgi:hypothetical protein
MDRRRTLGYVRPAVFCLSLAALGAFPRISAAGDDSIFRDGFEQPASFTLTVNNYLGWCLVGVNDGPLSNSQSTQYTFDQDVVVNLQATPTPGFVWRYWAGTDGDTGSGDPGTCVMSTCSATVTMEFDRTVLACCSFDGQTNCP